MYIQDAETENYKLWASKELCSPGFSCDSYRKENKQKPYLYQEGENICDSTVKKTYIHIQIQKPHLAQNTIKDQLSKEETIDSY